MELQQCDFCAKGMGSTTTKMVNGVQVERSQRASCISEKRAARCLHLDDCSCPCDQFSFAHQFGMHSAEECQRILNAMCFGMSAEIPMPLQFGSI